MAMPWKFRRAIGLMIPLFTTLLFWGVLKAVFGVGLNDNIASTGITVNFVFGALNAWLWYLVYRHQIG